MYGGPKRGLAIVWLALTQTGIWVCLMKHTHDSNRGLSRHRLLGVPHQINSWQNHIVGPQALYAEMPVYIIFSH